MESTCPQHLPILSVNRGRTLEITEPCTTVNGTRCPGASCPACGQCQALLCNAGLGGKRQSVQRGESNPHQFIYTINESGKGPTCALGSQGLSLNISLSGFQRQTAALSCVALRSHNVILFCPPHTRPVFSPSVFPFLFSSLPLLSLYSSQ